MIRMMPDFSDPSINPKKRVHDAGFTASDDELIMATGDAPWQDARWAELKEAHGHRFSLKDPEQIKDAQHPVLGRPVFSGIYLEGLVREDRIPCSVESCDVSTLDEAAHDQSIRKSGNAGAAFARGRVTRIVIVEPRDNRNGCRTCAIIVEKLATGHPVGWLSPRRVGCIKCGIFGYVWRSHGIMSTCVRSAKTSAFGRTPSSYWEDIPLSAFRDMHEVVGMILSDLEAPTALSASGRNGRGEITNSGVKDLPLRLGHST